jgi:hypothetical protein
MAAGENVAAIIILTSDRYRTFGAESSKNALSECFRANVEETPNLIILLLI